VLTPVDGYVVEGTVLKKNKMGLYVIYKDAIRILVPRDLHIGNEDFESLDINDTITIEIRKSRFQIRDTFILSVGVFIAREGAEVTAAAENTSGSTNNQEKSSGNSNSEEEEENDDLLGSNGIVNVDNSEEEVDDEDDEEESNEDEENKNEELESYKPKIMQLIQELLQ
jgi:hypothetical protein